MKITNNSQKKVCFILAAHLPQDERVWFHQRVCLMEYNFRVTVISTKINKNNIVGIDPSLQDAIFCFDDNAMSKKVVCKKVYYFLKTINPNVIICDNPLAVFYAHYYKHKSKQSIKIILDITEFYPSKKNVRHLKFIRKYTKIILLKILSLCAGYMSDAFIFGEYYKSLFYKRFFSKKPSAFLPYYPDLKYFLPCDEKKNFLLWNLFYSGRLNYDKGFDNVIKSSIQIAKDCKDYNFVLTILTADIVTDHHRELFSYLPDNLKINLNENKPFEEFCKFLTEVDICFDLRIIDRENTLCLPIKLFYYAAAGKPVIYSDLKSIKNQLGEQINDFGFTVRPDDFQQVSSFVCSIVKNPSLYVEKCTNARNKAEQKYNWLSIKSSFIKLVKDES